MFVAEEASGICRPSRGSKEVHWLNRSSGTFFNPDYPVPYPDNTWCIWIISVPAGKRVKLKFEDFEIERVSHDCALSMRDKKYVQILDGQVSASKYLALYCGYHGPASSDVYSTGRYMWVEFSSAIVNSYPRFKGFKAHFEAVDPDFRKYYFFKIACMRIFALRYFLIVLIGTQILALAISLHYKIKCERGVISRMDTFSQELMR